MERKVEIDIDRKSKEEKESGKGWMEEKRRKESP